MAFLREGACSDGMSDVVHPYSVNVSLPAAQARNAVTVSFEAGRVHGFAGCNQFMGSYTLDGGRLALGMLGGDDDGVPRAGDGAVESRFLKAFAGALKVAVAGNRMTLTPPDGGEALQFERAPPPRLEGVLWEVTG